jgi:hypothetical protein
VPYMTYDDPQAHIDMQVKPTPEKHPRLSDPVPCPKCQGYGGWHLQLDWKPGVHFNAACNQCNSWGWVQRGTLNESCIHDFEEVRVRMHVYKNVCRKCGHTNVVDSSG